tara:strand:+ start:936 stop:1295 length:360 start_codon:yes stop_codon:yes gene_type:complete
LPREFSGLFIKIISGAIMNIKDKSGKDHVQPDMVNRPPHYIIGKIEVGKIKIECIDAIQAMLTPEEFRGYLRGTSLKYRWRYRYKDGMQDLDKAEWYEKRLKEHEELHKSELHTQKNTP